MRKIFGHTRLKREALVHVYSKSFKMLFARNSVVQIAPRRAYRPCTKCPCTNRRVESRKAPMSMINHQGHHCPHHHHPHALPALLEHWQLDHAKLHPHVHPQGHHCPHHHVGAAKILTLICRQCCQNPDPNDLDLNPPTALPRSGS